MNFLEVIVPPCFEEQLSLFSEDLNICGSTAFPANTQLKRPAATLLCRNPLGKAEQGWAPTHRHCRSTMHRPCS